MRFIRRALIIFCAFLVACAVGSITMTLIGLLGENAGHQALDAFLGAFALMAALSFLPALCAIAVGEVCRRTALSFYLISGALIGTALQLTIVASVMSFEILLLYLRHMPGTVLPTTAVFAAAGAIAGSTYWLIAGRNAGRWRETPTAVQT